MASDISSTDGRIAAAAFMDAWKAQRDAAIAATVEAENAAKNAAGPQEAHLVLVDEGDVEGPTGDAFTPLEMVEVRYVWDVADASELVSCFDPGYDQRLQGRNRGSLASRAQVSKMAASLRGELLLD